MLGESATFFLATVLLVAVVAVSVTVLTGWAGQMSIGQWALAGVGGVFGAKLVVGLRRAVLARVRRRGRSPGGVVALLLGLPALRLEGTALAVVTLGFAVAAASWLFDQSWFQGTGFMARPSFMTTDRLLLRRARVAARRHGAAARASQRTRHRPQHDRRPRQPGAGRGDGHRRRADEAHRVRVRRHARRRRRLPVVDRDRSGRQRRVRAGAVAVDRRRRRHRRPRLGRRRDPRRRSTSSASRTSAPTSRPTSACSPPASGCSSSCCSCPAGLARLVFGARDLLARRVTGIDVRPRVRRTTAARADVDHAAPPKPRRPRVRRRRRCRAATRLHGGEPLFPIVVLFLLNARRRVRHARPSSSSARRSPTTSTSTSATFGTITLLVDPARAVHQRARRRTSPTAGSACRSRSRARRPGARSRSRPGSRRRSSCSFVMRVGSSFGKVVNEPVHGALIADFYSPRARVKAFGIHSLANPAGAAVGAVLAGVHRRVRSAGARRSSCSRSRRSSRSSSRCVCRSRRAVGSRSSRRRRRRRSGQTARRLWAIRSLRYQWIGWRSRAGAILGIGVLVPFYLRGRVRRRPRLARRAHRGSAPCSSAFGVLVGTAVAQRRLNERPSEGLRLLCWTAVVAAASLARARGRAEPRAGDRLHLDDHRASSPSSRPASARSPRSSRRRRSARSCVRPRRAHRARRARASRSSASSIGDSTACGGRWP